MLLLVVEYVLLVSENVVNLFVFCNRIFLALKMFVVNVVVVVFVF